MAEDIFAENSIKTGDVKKRDRLNIGGPETRAREGRAFIIYYALYTMRFARDV